MRRIILTVTALLALPLQSCCSLARLFCGPDKSEWVSARFDTPELTVRTFLEALRRDDPSVIYDCLSDPLRAHLGIDKGTTKMIWPKLRDEVPGLHLAGYATVPQSTRPGKDRAMVDLEVEGRLLPIELVRQCHWEVRYRRPNMTGPLANVDRGGQVANVADFVTITPSSKEDYSIVTLKCQKVITGSEDVPPEDILSVVLEHTWRIISIGNDPRMRAR